MSKKFWHGIADHSIPLYKTLNEQEKALLFCILKCLDYGTGYR